MWTLTSSVLLASLLVTGLSFPSPDDDEYDIPDVGVGGPRNQYYILHRDGTYKYGYDTVHDGYESTMRHSHDRQDGAFGYRDPDSGQQIRLEYKSGTSGFVPTGDHIPKPSAAFTEAFASARKRSDGPFVDPLAGTHHTDRSYDFGFSSDDHSRSEQSDSDGTVTGTYSYVDEFGIKRNFQYRAGKGIGFVIEGDGLTQPIPERPSQRRVTPSVRTPSRVRQEQQQQTFRAHTTPSRRPQTFRSQEQAGGLVQTTRSDDGSYSFSYKAGDHERRESADSDLNVEGSFSFVADDGKRRTLNYNAGSGTGFEARGDHLPVAPEVQQFGVRIPSTRKQTTQTLRSSSQAAHSPKRQDGYFAPSIPQIRQKHPSTTGQVRTGVRTASQFEEANIKSQISPAGPYYFKYDTSSHSRQESGNDDNEVTGEFSFVADDGVRREIKYEAGSDTGFIAEGDHIPVGPIVPGAPSGQPTGRLVRLRSTPFVDPLANTAADASYNFEFESETYSRSETADEDGNVVGTYTMVDEDGNKITYRFRAGKGIGFETEEISRTKVTPPARQTLRHGTSSFQQRHRQQVDTKKTVLKAPSRPAAVVPPSRKTTPQRKSTSFTGSFTPKQRTEVFPGFTLNQYEAKEGADKFGYVLRFD